ncbi:MAG: ATPase [Pirellulaceae bacterium]|nr:MAG: ATPase [Pirellulaceae bacterium]
MFRNMLIRKKTLYITVALTVTLMLLMLCSLRGVYKYRDLARNIGTLSAEVKEIWRLNNYVNEMRSYLRPVETFSTPSLGDHSLHRSSETRTRLLAMLDFVRRELKHHEARIRAHLVASDPLLATNRHELQRIKEIQRRIDLIEKAAYDAQLDRTGQIDEHLEELGFDLNELFGYLTDRMAGFREEMRSRYRTWIGMIVATTLICLVIVGGSFLFFRRGVVHPFKILLEDSRRIAGGDFHHRIRLQSGDELGELAKAMNEMTERFVAIERDLNEKVEQRTREVVRSEQLASVGYLAAGLAHEINNPLGAIAWSVDALESRLFHLLRDQGASAGGEAEATATAPSAGQGEEGVVGGETNTERAAQLKIIQDYLTRIQDAAFRCREILSRLLDFARLGETSEPEETDIHTAVMDIIDLVRPVPQYRHRPIRFAGIPGLKAWVRPAEFKQVVMNLLTNALDACDDGQSVYVTLEAHHDHFVVRVSDEGCGMTDEVLRHLFRPFFTRRRDGRGTGLGLSISHQIVQDHGGELTADSPGPGKGSTLLMKLPYRMEGKRTDGGKRAA